MEKSIYRGSVSGSVEFLKKLMEEDGGTEALAKAAVIGPFKETPPLHVAAMLGHLDFAKLLLRHFPNQVTPLDSQRRTPLHYAAAAGHVVVVKEILSSSIHDDYARTAIHVPDADGNTPLHLAIMNGHLGVVNELVSCGALEVVGYGLDGRTGKCLLHFCVLYGRLEALKSLLESREVKDDQVLAITDGDGNTVLHLAAALNQLETLKYLLKNSEVKGKVNTLNGQGSTALDIAQQKSTKPDGKRAEILEAITAAGGSSATKLRDAPQTINIGDGMEEILPETVVLNLEPPSPSPSTSKKETYKPPQQHSNDQEMGKQLKKQQMEIWREQRINALMISATLIAAMVYQGALNPPGGFLQADVKDPNDETKILYSTGRSVMGYVDPSFYAVYIINNTASFMVSMATIALLMSGLKQRTLIGILSVVTWVNMLCVTVAYILSVVMNSKQGPPDYSKNEYRLTTYNVIRFVCVWPPIEVLLYALILWSLVWSIKKVRGRLKKVTVCFKKLLLTANAPDN